MKEIKLSKNQTAFIDDVDYDKISKFKWYVTKIKGDVPKYYALTTINNKQHYLHNIIMSPPIGYEIDHVDTNGLNCTRSNMRLATRVQNTQNRGIRVDNTSGYKGVSLNKHTATYIARITINKKRISLGYYDTALKAAAAYNKAAVEYFKEFANLNNI